MGDRKVYIFKFSNHISWTDRRPISAIFWDVTRRGVVIIYRRFETTYRSHLLLTYEDGTDTLYRNVGKQLPHDAA
jgi:hypothetical protein